MGTNVTHMAHLVEVDQPGNVFIVDPNAVENDILQMGKSAGYGLAHMPNPKSVEPHVCTPKVEEEIQHNIPFSPSYHEFYGLSCSRSAIQ